MSEQAAWNNSQLEELSGGTRSSQDTLCSQDNAEYGNRSQPAGGLHQCNIQANEDASISFADTVSHQMAESFQRNDCQSMTVNQDQTNSLFNITPSMFIDEDTQMFGSEVLPGSSVADPYDITSPGCEPGDVSSPFEAMESDGLNDPDDSMFSTSSTTMRRPFHNMYQPETFSTTTPGGSSDDDPYSSSSSRKKRRRTKKEMHPSLNFTQDHFHNFPSNSQISSPSFISDTVTNGNEFTSASQGFNVAHQRGGSQIGVNNSDSNLFNTILKANRRLSNASESNQSSVSCPREKSILDSSINNSVSGGVVENDSSINPGKKQESKSLGGDRRRRYKNSSLQTVYPASSHGCTLQILVQPEDQHRARYLTEGSRGPVKDNSQQGFPQLQLDGYSGKTTLNVFVGTETEDKVGPHGFYQACKVTGRNTTACEEIEIESTKVIVIPFDAQEAISVDCVGILKLRNADVELRIGPKGAKKRSQTVRLVFRVTLDDLPGTDKENPCILQVVSNRINCTQPRGHPEITKKSLERCPVEGNQEMFIIGRNFHRGTKVIFQDSEEPDGSHWSCAGSIDKDTFNQSHLVVTIPPYHDLTITKSVNVQLCVEYNGKKCDPHSFTYNPSPKTAQKEAAPEPEVTEPVENTLKTILDPSKIDRKLLEALFAQLLRPGTSDAETSKPKPNVDGSSQNTPTNSEPPTAVPSVAQVQPNSIFQSGMSMQPLTFTADNQFLPSTVQKPVPLQNAPNVPVTSRVIIKPNTFGINTHSAAFSNVSSFISNPVVMTSQPFKPVQHPISTSGIPGTLATGAPIFATTYSSQQGSSQAPAIPIGSVGGSSAFLSQGVKTEERISNTWHETQASFPTPAQPTQQLISGSISMPQQLSNNITDVAVSIQTAHLATSMSAQVCQALTDAQQSNHFQASVQQTDHGQSIPTTTPQQTSTPVQEMATETTNDVRSVSSFAETNQWPSHVVEAAPNMMYNNNNLVSRVSAPSVGNVFSVPLQQRIATQTVMSNSVTIPNIAGQGNSQSVQPSSAPMQQLQQQNHWEVSSQPMQTASANVLASPNTNVTSMPQAGAMQWQPIQQEVDKTPADLFHNDNSRSGMPLQHSSSGELVFNRKNSGQATSVEHSQAQVFTLGGAMSILSQANKLEGNNSAVMGQGRGSFSGMLVLPHNTTERPVAENDNPVDTLSPTTAMPDTGLSIGFGNNFSLNDNDILASPKVMTNSVLQTIISDCTNASGLNAADDTASNSHLGQSHLFEESLQTSMSQSTLNQNSIDQAASGITQMAAHEDLTMNGASVQRTPQFGQPADVEMVPAAQAEKEQFVQPPPNYDEFLNQPVVDTNIFLVNPNCVQPQMSLQRETSVASSLANGSTAPSNNAEPTMQSNTLCSTSDIELPSYSNSFQTIDSSVLRLSAGDANQLDQAFGFAQLPTSNGGS